MIKRHVKTTPITAEDYLRNRVCKKSVLKTAYKFDELVDHYTKLYKHVTPKKPGTIGNLVMNTPHTVLLSLPSPGKVQ